MAGKGSKRRPKFISDEQEKENWDRAFKAHGITFVPCDMGGKIKSLKRRKNMGWIGFDLDGTLAHYDEWMGVEHIGKPIKPIVDIAKKYVEDGQEIKIFTARVSVSEQIFDAMRYIKEWLREAGLPADLEITCEKDYHMHMLYDDRCVQVEPNTGKILQEKYKDLRERVQELEEELA